MVIMIVVDAAEGVNLVIVCHAPIPPGLLALVGSHCPYDAARTSAQVGVSSSSTVVSESEFSQAFRPLFHQR